jgi:hypothetical protein
MSVDISICDGTPACDTMYTLLGLCNLHPNLIGIVYLLNLLLKKKDLPVLDVK